jgi:CheY-like chemotaxis protein
MINDVARFLGITVQALGILVWPGALLLLAARFHGPISEFLKNIGQLRVSAFGVEASVTKGREEAAAALGAAEAKQAAVNGDSATADIEAIADALPTPSAQRLLRRSRILWVDDNPENNRFERQALEALGIRTEISTSTDDALTRVQAAPYDLIISDMARGTDRHAGYTLLSKLRELGKQTPFVIYASSSSPTLTAEARAHGAVDYLNQPAALVRLVTKLLA